LDPEYIFPKSLTLFTTYPTMSATEADNTVLQPLTNGDIIASPHTKDEVHDSKENLDLKSNLKALASEVVGKATEMAAEVSLLIFFYCFMHSIA